MPLVRISLIKGRSRAQRAAIGEAVHRAMEQKRALYRRIAASLHEAAGVRPEDVLVSLVEVGREDWSFGHGIASYAPEMRKMGSVPI